MFPCRVVGSADLSRAYGRAAWDTEDTQHCWVPFVCVNLDPGLREGRRDPYFLPCRSPTYVWMLCSLTRVKLRGEDIAKKETADIMKYQRNGTKGYKWDRKRAVEQVCFRAGRPEETCGFKICVSGSGLTRPGHFLSLRDECPPFPPLGVRGWHELMCPLLCKPFTQEFWGPGGIPTDPSRPWLRPLSDLTRCPLCGEMAWSCFRLESNLLSVLETRLPQESLTLFIHSFIKFYRPASCRALCCEDLALVLTGLPDLWEGQTGTFGYRLLLAPVLLCDSKHLLPSYAVTSWMFVSDLQDLLFGLFSFFILCPRN